MYIVRWYETVGIGNFYGRENSGSIPIGKDAVNFVKTYEDLVIYSLC